MGSERAILIFGGAVSIRVALGILPIQIIGTFTEFLSSLLCDACMFEMTAV